MVSRGGIIMFTKEDFVSLDTAKMLKEKGFDEYCGAYYHLNWDDITEDECFEVATDNDFKNSNNVYRVGAPTLYEAHKWLMDEFGLCVVVSPYVYEEYDEDGYACSTDMYWKVSINRLSDGFRKNLDTGYDIYEDAFDKGIREALKLI